MKAFQPWGQDGGQPGPALLVSQPSRQDNTGPGCRTTQESKSPPENDNGPQGSQQEQHLDKATSKSLAEDGRSEI